MDDFECLQPLSTHPRFTVFEAYAKKLGLQVVLKQCACATSAEVEYFVRSALIKTRDRDYSQPLQCIFTSGEKTSGLPLVNFVWRRGEALDTEVENDRESMFPSGKSGLEERKTIFTNLYSGVSVKRSRCLTLGKDVICKVFKDGKVLDLNSAFKEALSQVKCSHPNVCDFLDFRVYQGKKGSRCAYIVTEWLEPNLAAEIQKRVPDDLRYDEVELMSILKDVTAGLLHAKSQGLTHGDIKPSNILRGPQGLKLANFEASWCEVLCPATAEMHISPEALEATGNAKMLQQPFESDVFALGTTMLHLAVMELPEGTTMSRNELQVVMQRKVQALKYSEELKRLLTAMLSFVPSDRPPLESVQTDAERIYQQAVQLLTQEALRLRQQASSGLVEGKNAECIELTAAAHAIFSRFPEDKDVAINLYIWGVALDRMGRSVEAVEKCESSHAIYSRLLEDKNAALILFTWGVALHNMRRSAEAVEKYEAAHVIYSRFPEDNNTANNLYSWGVALYKTGRSAEAVEKYEAAHAIYSRLPEDKDTANNLFRWGVVLDKMGRSAEAVEKFEAAHAIFSRLPEDNDVRSKIGRSAEAVEKYEAAHAIYSRFSEDKITALILFKWGKALDNLKRNAEAVKKYEAAHTIYSRFPEDKNTANNLFRWGVALDNLKRSAEAVEEYKAAHAIYSQLPENKNTANNLHSWGKTLDNMGRSAEAVKKHEAAHAIYSRFPEDKDTANNLFRWGVALDNLKRSAEAVEKYEAAHAIYSRLPEDKDTAFNLHNLGLEHEKMGRSAEAVEEYKAAHAIYSQLPENKNTANNLHSWGKTLDNMGRIAEAVEKYKAAHTIYSRFPEETAIAYNLYVCGIALGKMGRSAEAVEKHEAARAIFVLCQFVPGATSIDALIAYLR